MEPNITLIEGPMYAGKSKALFDELEALKIQMEEVLAIKIAFHTRDGNYIKSRAYPEKKLPCNFVNSTQDIKRLIEENHHKIIVVDEAQFMQPDIIPVLLESKKPVLCAGLDTDFRKDKWATTEAIEKVASKVIKIEAYCDVCKKPAKWTAKFSKCSSSVELEGEGVFYYPRCDKHWTLGK